MIIYFSGALFAALFILLVAFVISCRLKRPRYEEVSPYEAEDSNTSPTKIGELRKSD
jgi:hypothetical protein